MNAESTTSVNSNDALKLAIESIPLCIVVVDFSATIVFANAETERLLGYERNELLRQNVRALFPEQTYVGIPFLQDSYFADPSSSVLASLECNAVRKDGFEFPVEVCFKPLKLAGASLMFGTLVDMSAKLKAAEKSATSQLASESALAVAVAEAQRKAAQVEERLNLALKSSRVGTWNWNIAEGTIIWDDYIHPLYGLEPGTFAGKYENFEEMLHPDDRGRVAHEVRNTIENDAPFDTEFRVIWPDESVHILGSRGKVYRDIDGLPLQMTGVCWDITERKQSELALAAVNAQLEGVLDAATQISIIATSVDGIITVFNSGAQNMLGYTEEEIVGKQTPQILHVAEEVIARGEALTSELGYPVEAFEVFVAYARQGRFDHREWTYVRKDGRTFPVSLVVTAVKNQAGEITGFLGVAEDITERKRMMERLCATVDAAPTAILVVSAVGKISLANNQAVEMFGYERAEMIGQKVEMLIPERFRATHPAHRDSFFRNPVQRDMGAALELFGRKRDGTEFPLKVGLSPIETEDGPAVICGVFNTTNQILAVENLRAAKEAAESASRAKSSFLANMSHEIRTPMNGIIGMSQLLAQTNLRSNQRDYLETIEQSAHILLRLLNDILDFSKIEAGKLELDIVEFRLSECVARASQLILLKAAEKGLELACRIAPEIPDHLRGDPGRVQQVLVNLLGNAVKFTEAGEIYVNVNPERITADQVRLHFSVSDTGIGIPPNKLEQVFRPFEQAESSTTRRFGGTGLGLTISKQLVDMMHGNMFVESEMGRGSSFHFTAEFGVAAAQLHHEPAELSSLADVPVLVVDDNLTNRKILSEMLRYWNMRPILADSAVAARSALRKAAENHQPIRLILLDHHMPSEDGFHFADSLKQASTKHCPIIMISSGSAPIDVDECARHGIARFMSKPVIASELLNEVLRQFGHTDEILANTVSTTVSVPSRRVLLVEDNEINRRVALGLLRSRGHLVEIAENGQEALNMLETHEFDVVLMDMQMPVMDGYEATTAIRALEHEVGGHMPIVAMTAEALKGDRERCLAVGMDDYVAKPISQSELYRAVESFPALCSPVPTRSPNLVDKTVVQSSESVDSIALPETPRAPKIIDWKLARARLPEGALTMNELVGLVKIETPNLLASIQQSIVARDSRTLRRSAHTMKSSVSLFGADSLAQLAQTLENLGRLESFDGIEELLSKLEKQVESFMQDLDEPLK